MTSLLVRRALLSAATIMLFAAASACGLLSDPPAANEGAADAGREASATEEPTREAARQSEWVRERIQAVQDIYGFTERGEEWQDTYDFRHMPSQPAWFGSHGYQSWAGAGEAIPRSIIHELSHSYWGAFPVEGRPDLAPDYSLEGEPPVLEAYRQDLLAFMRQPPDRFEPLRDRFRNMPNLDDGSYPDLHHFGEADMVYTTGGRLGLLPPILRKYYGAYLTESGVGDDIRAWVDALAWWKGLSREEQREAGDVFGLQHFPLGNYAGLPPENDASLDPALLNTLAGEDRQRLKDFARHFDQIVEQRSNLQDAIGRDRGFQFWRGYLRAMLSLHTQYPEVLSEQTGERGRQLGSALDFYDRVEPLPPAEQATEYRANADQGDIASFAPLLKSRALLELFPVEGSDAPDDGVIQSTASAFVDELRGLISIADEALQASRAGSAEDGAAMLADQFGEMDDDDLRSSVDPVFNFMRETDPELARRTLSRLPEEILVRLLEVRPSAARADEIPVERLFGALGIEEEAGREALVSGVAKLTANSSGNFAIDRPYEEAVYDILDVRAAANPALAIEVFQRTELRPIPWIMGRPKSASAALGSDPAATVELFVGYDGPEPTPERLTRALAYADPGVAAEIMAASDEGHRSVVTGVLNSLAYDRYWETRGRGPERRLESAAALLEALQSALGADWLRGAVLDGVASYTSEIEKGNVEPEFRDRHVNTLETLSDLTGGETSRLIEDILSELRS